MSYEQTDGIVITMADAYKPYAGSKCQYALTISSSATIWDSEYCSDHSGGGGCRFISSNVTKYACSVKPIRAYKNNFVGTVYSPTPFQWETFQCVGCGTYDGSNPICPKTHSVTPIYGYVTRTRIVTYDKQSGLFSLGIGVPYAALNNGLYSTPVDHV